MRRFKLLPEFHFIALYRSILDDKGLGGTAGDRLCDVFLTRGQYAQANNVLEKTIAKHGKGNDDSRTKLHQQITGNWGRFEPVSTVAAGSRPRLPLVFRNATQITLTAAPVDMSAVVDDTMDYLKRGGGLDWERANPGSIAGRLIKEQNSKYLGPTAAKWNATLTPRDRYRDTRTDLEVPVDRAGAWWIQATMPNGNSFCTLVWIVDSVFLEKGMAGTKQWWLADAVDGAPIKGVEVEFFGFRTVNLAQTNAMGRRTENRTKQFKRATDDDGRVVLKVTDFDPEMQWMAVARRNGSPPNISGFESIFAQDDGNLNGSRDITYAVSDRPIYKPGDQVHLKYFFRNVGYSDPNEEAFSNKQGTLLVQNGRGDEVIKLEKLKTDALGTVESDWMIPKDAALGNWNAAFMIGDRIASAVSFRVEEYRKPEYEVKVEAPTEPVKLGEKFKITVLANYFHGSPVRNAMVDVVVKRSSIGDRWFPCGRWDWLYGAGSWWNSSQADWHPSWKSWGCIPPNPPWWGQERWTPDELVSNFHVPIGFDGKAVIEIDTAMSKRIHGDLDAKYTIEARVVDASRREERGIGTVIVARKPFEVVVWLDRGYAHAGDEVMVAVSAANLSGKPVADAKGRLSLFLLASGNGGRVDEREVNSFAVVTDRQGEVHHRFAAPPVGQYRVAVSLTSTCGDHVDGAVILNVHGSGRTNSKDWHFGALEIVADKATYASGEIAKLRVNSDHENAHVWLFQKSSDVDEHEARRIQLEGKSLEVEVPVNRRDMPNLFIEGVTVHDAKVHTAVRQILVPPAGQALDVVLEAAKAEVKPQEESSLRITVRDAEGKPFIGIATLSVY
ncbi:MAG: MG2 domain-containing protein, partial [Akkermansiaceae bacterium]|nr:MG2 domain-containing protein [Akkermansiaceae bacterium]